MVLSHFLSKSLNFAKLFLKHLKNRFVLTNKIEGGILAEHTKLTETLLTFRETLGFRKILIEQQ